MHNAIELLMLLAQLSFPLVPMLPATVCILLAISRNAVSASPVSANGQPHTSLHDDGGLVQLSTAVVSEDTPHKSDGVDFKDSEETMEKEKERAHAWAAHTIQSVPGVSNTSFEHSSVFYHVPESLQSILMGGERHSFGDWLRSLLILFVICLTVTCMSCPSAVCWAQLLTRPTRIYWAQLSKIYSTKFPEFTHSWQGETETAMTPYGQSLKNAYHVINVNKAPGQMPEYPDPIETLRKFTDLSKEDMQKQWKCYFDLVKERESEIKMLKRTLGDEWLVSEPGPEAQRVWGSRRQYASAAIVVEKLFQRGQTEVPLHPCFGTLLSPTLGAVGPDSTSMLFGGVGSPSIVNACVHDAYGYLCFYHRACLGRGDVRSK